ncbi:hypothetical protein [Actinomadura madurae]|uniref:hypothetical protein n=1 Tax=Actinomadura madurae TaxID=1993 RepID=UPI002025F4B3|nr:hypothetical protein [Actinomadura madurae]MCP9952613.1 hypothetical protein [Actinomadura madurae]MCP9981841.1 hypothetical protein [Actinomadura madurae]MCQ0006635.1 hypothetical protein [Actinomadura madurae]MCQ0018064.1 hypothetical protein [Actinomadura madurae]URM98129.1 hypothetical protein LUW76_29290 [Actinomadura madurae]
MATTPRRTPAHQMFNNVLSSLHEHSGNDTKDEIAGVVVRVPELYPDYRGGIPAGLSPINIYKKLRGDHLTLPTGPQLSVLVLALQHLAYRGHVRDDDPGCATLPGWQALLNQARMLDRHQRSQGRYIRDSEHGVDRPLTLPVPVPPGSAVRTSAAHIEVASIDVTAVEVHQLVALGHYARTLALRASDADPGAFYEIAVALGTAGDPYRGRAGVFAVAAAAAARGPSPASDLLTPDLDVDAGKAAAHARVLAHAATAHDDHDAARVFAYCAGRADSPGLQAQAPRLRD